MKIKTHVASFSAWIFLAVAPLQAHHAFKSEFDMGKPLHLEGKVTELEWMNPHVYFHLAVLDSKGQTADWRVELLSPNDLSRLGMTRMTLGIGRDVVVDGLAAKIGDRLVGAMELRLNPEGKTYSLSEAWKRWDPPPPASQTNGKLPAVLPVPTFKEPAQSK